MSFETFKETIQKACSDKLTPNLKEGVDSKVILEDLVNTIIKASSTYVAEAAVDGIVGFIKDMRAGG